MSTDVLQENTLKPSAILELDDGNVKTEESYINNLGDIELPIVMADKDGKNIWRTIISGLPSSSHDVFISESEDNNLFIGGSFYQKNGRKSDWLVHIDKSGNILWKQIYGSNGADISIHSQKYQNEIDTTYNSKFVEKVTDDEDNIPQEQDTTQTEELAIVQIENKAKEDSKMDFNALCKVKWCGGSCITSWGGIIGANLFESEAGHVFGYIGLIFPIVASRYYPVSLPDYRELELSYKSSEYQIVYRPIYLKETKKQRLKYSLCGPASCSVGVAFILLVGFGPSATCFAEGTEITMADGSFKSIEDIQVGERVLSYNLEAGKTEPDEVLELYSPTNNNMMHMEFSDGTVVHSTFDHPYYVKDKGWCSLKPDVTKEIIVNISDVGQLEKGDICLTLVDGELKEIHLVQFKEVRIMQKTYTIKRLRNNNAFFAEGILVGVETVKD